MITTTKIEKLQFTVIKNEKQYNEYSDLLFKLIETDYKKDRDLIELLSLLIEKWDEDHSTQKDLDPVQFLKGLMEFNNLKAKDIADLLSLSKGTVSKMLNYQKGFSKESIRILADRFKVRQDAFNKPYKLVNKNNNELQVV